MMTNSLRLLAVSCFVAAAAAAPPSCTGENKAAPSAHDYSKVLSTNAGYSDLPGFTRSVYQRDHALVAPESRVWAANPGWAKTLTAHLISPASGAHFSMYLADCQEGAEALPAAPGVERFVFVLQGEGLLWDGGKEVSLKSNYYVYFPVNDTSKFSSKSGAGLLVYERVYASKGKPELKYGLTDDSPVLPVAGEVFELRKLLPATADYDFNVHVMDFQPGQFLAVKEVHYNQHGLLMLEGKGIYRLADKWYPVQAGDAIYMAPFVVQWFAALGDTRTRYIILKDTTVDPLF